jgi:hypothetical protein
MDDPCLGNSNANPDNKDHPQPTNLTNLLYNVSWFYTKFFVSCAQMFHWPNQIQKIKYLNKSYTLKPEFKFEAFIVNRVHLTTY